MTFLEKLHARMEACRICKRLPLIFVLISMFSFFFWIPKEHLGYLHDSVYYIAGAESIAQGNGYRCIFWEGEPPISLYPPLQSFYLSLFWRLDPNYFSNPPVLYIAISLQWIVFIVLFYLILVEFGIPRWGAALTSIVTGFNLTWYCIRLFQYADILGAIWGIIAMLIAIRINSDNINKGSLLLGLTFALMYLTRTSSIAFIAGAFFILLYYGVKTQKYLHLLYFSVPIISAIIIWMLFPKGLSNYGSFFVEEYKRMIDEGKLITHYCNNVLIFISGSWFFDNIIYIFNRDNNPISWLNNAFDKDILYIAKICILLSLWIFSIAGLYKLRNSKLKLFILPAALYIAMHIIWPWEFSYRYFLILTPIICAGFYGYLNCLRKDFRNIVLITALSLLLINLPLNIIYCHEFYRGFNLPTYRLPLDYKIRSVAEWINSNVKPDEKIACSLNSFIYNLYKLSGRKFVPMKSEIDRGSIFENFKADYYICTTKGKYKDNINTNIMKEVFRGIGGEIKIYKSKK